MSDETEIKPDADDDIEAESAEVETGQAGDTPAEELTPEDRLAALEAEAADLKDKLLRTLAEADNVRKRAAKEVVDARAFAIEKFAHDLLSVSDNLTRALDVLPDEDRAALSEAGKGLLGGIEMTQKELHTVMARHGVTAIDAAPGAAFDPNFHQAVSQIPSDQPKDTIAQTFQTGWKIGERTLRAAMVAVSTGPAN